MTIRAPVKWHGGKYYQAKWIIEHFPAHRIYLEPFGGGASVLLNKAPVDVEFYNDLDQRITRLFRIRRDHGDRFLEKARLTLYSQVEFDEASQYPAGASDLDMALCDFIRWRQSFGGNGQTWSYTTSRARGWHGWRRKRLVDCHRPVAGNHRPDPACADRLSAGLGGHLAFRSPGRTHLLRPSLCPQHTRGAQPYGLSCRNERRRTPRAGPHPARIQSQGGHQRLPV